MKLWKDIISAVAPALATALGGPLAGLAVREIGGKILGKEEATENEVAAAIAGATPETLAKLRELDQQFQTRMAELGIKLEELENADRADARARDVAAKDRIPAILAIVHAAAFFALLFVMFTTSVPQTNRDAFNILLGMLSTSMLTIMTYYFGSSRGSKAKDEILGRAARR